MGWLRSLYGVATVIRIDKMIGLFCRILSLLYGSFGKETYNFIDPTNQSHPIAGYYSVLQYVVVCCSTLQCVAVRCSVLQYVAVCD